ncbi:hypothetical protein F2Q69_00061790 [Brassica cretica]|uniref:Uncharacterized protein n=1 Tax=Brassica cretica TaxID=69181 RepID=A0A8S9RL81_BRACR|nr:hypothetical protein F2Q69_00061790 [Brassica cretica]
MQCSFTELIHDDVELGINGVAHRKEKLTRFDRWFWRRNWLVLTFWVGLDREASGATIPDPIHCPPIS